MAFDDFNSDDPGVVRPTPFGNQSNRRSFGTQQRSFGLTDDQRIENSPGAVRPTPFNRGQTQIRDTGRSVTSNFARRQLQRPPQQRPVENPADLKPAASVFDVQQGGSALVSTTDGSAEANARRSQQVGTLFDAPIAGLSEGAVEQTSGNRFATVTDPGTGFSAPNYADDFTREAAQRYFRGGSSGPILGELSGVNQQTRDADPTRIDFQNQFFPSQTLTDVGNLDQSRLSRRQAQLRRVRNG